MSQTKIAVGMIDASSIGDAKVLQGDGSWVTPSAGAMTFISTSDISAAATYDFTGFTAASYDTYALHVMNLIPATDDVSLELLTSTDGVQVLILELVITVGIPKCLIPILVIRRMILYG